MSTPTYAEIIVPVTKDEQLATLLALAEIAEFPTTSWHAGSLPISLLDIEATAFAEESKVIAAIAKGGVLEDADEDWLELLVLNEYNLQRKQAIATRGTAILSCVPTAGPYTIDVNQLWASDAGNHRFNNITAGTLPSGGTLTLTWQAESPGIAYNLAPNTLNIMKTSLAGVTVNNPSTSWITQMGTNLEAPEALRQRAKDRWPDIGSGATAAAYRLWAVSADPTVTRVKVLEANNFGASAGGHVTVYIAGDSGALDATVVLAVTNYIETKRPLCVQVHVASALNHPVPVVGTLYVSPGYGANALPYAEANLVVLQTEIGIGATVYHDAIVEVLMIVPGALHCPLSSPAGDTPLAFNEVVQFLPTITIVET